MDDAPIFFNLLIAFGAFQAIFISIVFLADRQAILAKKLFALFLIIEGITLVERMLVETDLIHNFPHILGVSYPMNFIKPPIMLFMALSIANRQFKFRKIHLLHIIPFVLVFSTNIPFYFQDAASKIAFVKTFNSFVPTYQDFTFYLFSSFFINIGAYLLVSIRALRKYRKAVTNNQLANWYLRVLYLYTSALVIGFVYFVLQPSGLIHIPFFNIISMLTMTFLVQSVAFTFFTKSNIFNPKNSPVRTNIEQAVKDEKLIKSKLENDKVYLDESLNLDDFASSLSLSKKYVSYLINQHFGYTFKDLINQYRIEEAKAIMAKEVNSKRSLIEIAEESGFNNKVSFYRTFKKHTGKSPSEYYGRLKKSHSTDHVSVGKE